MDGLRFRAIGGSDPTISSREAAQQIEDEYSQDEVPIEPGFILELKKWQALCVETEGRWLFPSPVTGRPYHADSIRADYLVPTGLQLGLGRVGFYTFRHYSDFRAIPGEGRTKPA
jgi:hypothetical protein